VPPFPRYQSRRPTWPGLPGRASAAAAAVLLGGGVTAVMLVSAASAASAASAHAPSAARTAAGASALSVNWYESAPYYSTLDSTAPDLSQVMAATGQKAFDMAFILAGNGSCDPSWDGTDPVFSDTQVSGVINQVRAAGGDVTVSIGGYNGTKLG